MPQTLALVPGRRLGMEGWCGVNDKNRPSGGSQSAYIRLEQSSFFLRRHRCVYCSSGLVLPLGLTISRSKELPLHLFEREFYISLVYYHFSFQITFY